ncbi:MAG: tyrosine-protein phosphatase [Acidimicrobiia bacterium]|nr:tyrosine-protein phosphatase [Acidimicrobiia bacterium]
MTHSLMEGARNFRDVGDHRTKTGEYVKTGLIYRSDRLSGLTDSDLERFADLGIKTVVDFRPDVEKEMTGHNRLPDGVAQVTFAIGDAAMAPDVRYALEHGDFTALPDLEEGNRRLIREFSAEIGAALRVMADVANLPLVFHCIGGKDRTGMTAALLLAILGVPEEDIRGDYLRSNDALGTDPATQEAFLSKILSRNRRTTPLRDEERVALRRFFILEDSYFDAAWDEIHRVAGSFDSYVRNHLGLSEEETAGLRRSLLESG